MPNGSFTLRIKTPKGNYSISRARITLTTIANVLTNLKVYNCVAHQQCTTTNLETQTSNDALASYKIEIAPNPFSAYTTLNIKGNIGNTSYITISDKTGNVIEQHQVNNVSSVHLLEKAPAGIYFIKIAPGNIVETRKVIKM